MLGVVAWLLVRGLRQREMGLAGNLLELQRTGDWLGQPERLAERSENGRWVGSY